MFPISCTLENTECEKKYVLRDEKRGTTATSMKKSIEMQVAQEN